MGNRTNILQFGGEFMFPVHLQFLWRQQFIPELALRNNGLFCPDVDVGRLDRAAIRIVTLEERGIQHDAFDASFVTQLDDAPVVSGLTSPPGFPSRRPC